MMQMVYVAVDSPLHRLNPLSKVLAFLPVLLFLALTTTVWPPLAFIALTALLTLAAGRIPLATFLRNAGPPALLVLGFLLAYPLAVRPELVADSPIVLQLGPLAIRQAGLLRGLATGLRLYALILVALPFSLTTDASDFVRALVQQWRLPYRLGYAALAAFRFVPLLQSELGAIRAAHRVRGADGGGGLRGRLTQARRYAVPLLATAIRQAERTALAMDSRAFGAFPTRTYYRRLRYGLGDCLFVGGYWLVCLLVGLLLQRAGLLGPFVLLQRL